MSPLTTEKADQSPSDLLFIYYIEGTIPPAMTIEHGAFLGNWVEEDSSFLFFSEAADDVVHALCQKLPHLTLMDRFEMGYDEWQGGENEPFQAGILTVIPFRGETPPSRPAGTREIFLDPGVVFGNGAHPTTATCLELLADMGPDLAQLRVQDLGTGTGLLALGAGRLGARRVLAVDLNPLAVTTAKRNIWVNGLSRRILAVQGRAEELVNAPADLVVANIHYDIMKHLVAAKGFREKKEAILSGLLTSEARLIESKVTDLGFQVISHHCPDGIWNTFHIRQ